MVSIPTSRDIQYVDPQSGRIRPSGPSVGIGEGLSNLGAGLQNTAFNMLELRQREQVETQNKTGFDTSVRLAEFRSQEEQTFNQAREQVGSGIGFTRGYLEGYQKRANDFAKSNFEGLSPEAQARANIQLRNLGDSLYTKAYDYEGKAKNAYYENGLNTTLAPLRTSINSNAAPYDDLVDEGLAAIDAADMPEAWKMSRRQEWLQDAAESRVEFAFRENPSGAIEDLQQSVGVAPKVPSFSEGVNAAVDNAATANGLDPAMMRIFARIESSGNPNAVTGSYNGLFQMSREEFQKWGGGNIFSPVDNANAAARKIAAESREFEQQYGRTPTATDLYMQHQQGKGGYAEHLRNPDRPAWQNMFATGEGQQKGMNWAKLAIWGNVPNDVKAQYGSVENITSRQFVELWRKKVEGKSGPLPDFYEDIPYEQRQRLLSGYQSEYDKMRSQQSAATNDNYRLQIATAPSAELRNEILSNPNLDQGQQATLINSLDSALKEGAGVRDFMATFSGGGAVGVNSFDSEQTKIADKAYDQLIGGASDDAKGAITNDFVRRTGYIPSTVQAELRQGAASGQPLLVAQAMQATNALRNMSPSAFGFTGGSDLVRQSDAFKFMTGVGGYSETAAAQRLIDRNDPEKIRQMEAYIGSKPVKDFIKKETDPDAVLDVFDNQWLGSPKFPSEYAGAVVSEDFRRLLEESLFDTGDMEAALELTKEKIGRVYGVSDFTQAKNTIVKYPVEKAYPAIDGNHVYIDRQATEMLAEQGIETNEVYLTPVPSEVNGVRTVSTEDDIRAGRPASYIVTYVDQATGDMEMYPVPFYFDPKAEEQRMMDEATARNEASAETMANETTRAERRQSAPQAQSTGSLITSGLKAIGFMDDTIPDEAKRDPNTPWIVTDNIAIGPLYPFGATDEQSKKRDQLIEQIREENKNRKGDQISRDRNTPWLVIGDVAIGPIYPKGATKEQLRERQTIIDQLKNDAANEPVPSRRPRRNGELN